MNSIYISTDSFKSDMDVTNIKIDFIQNIKLNELSEQTVKVEQESITANFAFTFNGLKCSGTYTSNYETQEQMTERVLCSLLPKAKHKPFDYRGCPATPCCNADKEKLRYNNFSGAMQCIACGQIYELITKEESTDV